LTTLDRLLTMKSAAGQSATPLIAEGGNPPSESAVKNAGLEALNNRKGRNGGFGNPVHKDE